MPYYSTLSLAKENFRQMLAKAESFWDFCGITDESVTPTGGHPSPSELITLKIAAALEHIFIDGLPRPQDAFGNPIDAYDPTTFTAYHPCAIVFTADQNGLTLEVFEHGEQATGHLKLRLYDLLSAADTFGDEPTATAKNGFEESVGLVMDELRSMALQIGYMVFHKLALESGPEWFDPREAKVSGCRIRANLAIEWSGI